MSPERDDFQDDDERDEFASRSIFAAGWFRAVLVLTVLAIVVVISLPYLLNWFEPTPPPRIARPAEAPKPAPPVATSPAVTPAPPAAPAPATPPAAMAPVETKAAEPKIATPPPAPAPKPAEPKVAEKAAPAPAPKVAEKPAPAEPVRKAVAEKPAPKVAAEKSQAKPAAEKAPPKPAPKAVAEKSAPDKSTPEKKATVAEKAPAKTEKAAPTRVAKAEAPVPSRPVSTSAKSSEASSGTGNYFIQLGAFKEQKNADTLAKSLRDAGFPVQVTAITRGGNATPASEARTTVQQHELFVTETSVEKVNASLKGRGTAQAVSGGVAVRPAFTLQEAMSVSKRLTDDGLKVVIRPAGGPGTPSVASSGSGTSGGTTLHAVRVGGYPNRTSALAARDELSTKGHPGFLAEGPAK